MLIISFTSACGQQLPLWSVYYALTQCLAGSKLSIATLSVHGHSKTNLQRQTSGFHACCRAIAFALVWTFPSRTFHSQSRHRASTTVSKCLQVGVSHISIKGRLRTTMIPMLFELPVVGAVQVCCSASQLAMLPWMKALLGMQHSTLDVYEDVDSSYTSKVACCMPSIWRCLDAVTRGCVAPVRLRSLQYKRCYV